VAPSPVSALMSGLVIKAGIYGLLRLLCWLPTLPAGCGGAMVFIGVVGGVMGILYALSQRHLKRMLAYSSVEYIGISALGIGIGMIGRSTNQPIVAALGFAGAILHVLNHTLFKGLLFMSAGSVLHATGTADMERLGGLAKVMPVNAALFLLASLSICALPPFNGFVSEWFIYYGLFTAAGAGGKSAAVFAVVGLTALAVIGGLALASFARAFGVVFLGSPRDPAIHAHPTPPRMRIGMFVPAIACVVIGLAPAAIVPLLQRAMVPLRLAAPAQQELSAAMAPLTYVSVLTLILLLVIVLLMVLRSKLKRAAEAESKAVTWGCGYAFPSPRMQYTGSSFAATLVHLAREVLRTRRRQRLPNGYFSDTGELSTSTPDVALTEGFEPLFKRIARLFQRCWPLQQGRIQLYLIYIAAALVLVFLIEFTLEPRRSAPARQPALVGLEVNP